MTKSSSGGYDCFNCGIEYNPPITESEDISGQRWFKTIMFGGPTWCMNQKAKIAVLVEEENRAMTAFIQRRK